MALGAEVLAEYRKCSIFFEVAFSGTIEESKEQSFYEINGVKIDGRCLLAHADRMLRSAGLYPVYQSGRYGMLMTSTGNIPELTPRLEKRLGIVVFLDGKEPLDGESGLENVFPKQGQEIDIAYIVQ